MNTAPNGPAHEGKHYKESLRRLQIELVKPQRHLIKFDYKILILFEGRDGDDYTEARDVMLERTHSESAPWFIVRSDAKKIARLNLIRHIVSRVECPDRDEHLAVPDDQVIFPYEPSTRHRLAR